jgi:hypothetical protein
MLPERGQEKLIARAAGKPHKEAAGAIYVKLPKVQVRITGRVDAEVLRAVLEQLLG